MIDALFYLFAALAVAGALGMLLNVRNTVAGALSLVGTMVSLGAIYVLLDAYLIGVLQILVYAGAIVVVFLFVVMLLNLREDSFGPERLRGAKLIGVAIGALVGVELLLLLPAALGPAAAIPADFGGYRAVGTALFTDWVLAFEITSLLLLAAMVGAVILAKRSID
ncbi:MAG: NADH-quinone oxidoreductase subunit J [Myxococcota bacterium]